MLSQEIIDQHARLPRATMAKNASGAFQLRELERAYSLLCPPWDLNHSAPSHPSLARAYSNEARALAEPIYFERALVESASNALSDPESYAIACRIARLPYSPCMIEVDGAGARIGILCEGDREVRFSAFQGYGFVPGVRALCLGKGRFSFDSKHVYFEDGLGDESVLVDHLVSGLVKAVTVLCAFTTISGTTKKNQRRYDEAQQRKRLKRGRAPLLSYNVYAMAVPAPALESATDIRVHTGKGVRYHRRIGYLRISRHGDPEAHFTWVPADWRGNKDLGTVLKTRHAGLSKRTHAYIASHGTKALSALGAETI